MVENRLDGNSQNGPLVSKPPPRVKVGLRHGGVALPAREAVREGITLRTPSTVLPPPHRRGIVYITVGVFIYSLCPTPIMYAAYIYRALANIYIAKVLCMKHKTRGI